jgi:hypothetical protein
MRKYIQERADKWDELMKPVFEKANKQVMDELQREATKKKISHPGLNKLITK